MEKHRKIAGALQFLQTLYFSLLSIQIFTGLFSGTRINFLRRYAATISQFGEGAGVFYAILALAFLVAGICLIKGLRRARPFVWVMAIIGLFLFFPFGIFIGAYTIWVLVKKA